jgi:phosphate transport system permease protein
MSTLTPTAPPAAPTPLPTPPPPRVRIGRDPELVVHVLASTSAALGTTWMVAERILPVQGKLAFWLLAYAFFLLFLAAVSSTTLDRVGVVDRVVGALVASGGVLLVALLAGIVLFTFVRGREALFHWNFFTQTTAFIGPDAPLTEGGMYAAMVGTLEQVALSLVFSVPLGIATAVYLNEARGWLPKTVRNVVDAMSAVPTIVAGLFVYSMLVLRFGVERSGIAAAFALSISMVPVVTRTAEVVLRLVPNGLREASLALGCTQWQTVKGVVLPTARSGLVTAVLLGVARVIGETSPVLLVAGSTNELNYDPTHGPQVSLPLFVFNQVRLPLDQAIARAFGAAVVLLLLVVVLFALARMIGGRPLGKPTWRSRRRRRRALRTAARRTSSERKPA